MVCKKVKKLKHLLVKVYIINFLIHLISLLWTYGIMINFKDIDLNRGIRYKAAKDIIAISVVLELHTIQTELKN